MALSIILLHKTLIKKELKAWVRCFSSSSPWYSLNNYEKYFLFHIKSSFLFWDIQVFVFLSFPLSFPVSYWLKWRSKRNIKVYDVRNCLNKNLVTHFAWYLEKKKRYDIETLSIHRVLSKGYFYGKIMQKMCTKIYSKAPFNFW